MADGELPPNPEIDGMSLEELTRLCFGNMPFSGAEVKSTHPVRVERQLQMDWSSQREHPEGYSAREFFIVRNYAKAHKEGEGFKLVPGTETFEYIYTFMVSNPTDDSRSKPYFEEQKGLYLNSGGGSSGILPEDEALRLVREYLWPAYNGSDLTK